MCFPDPAGQGLCRYGVGVVLAINFMVKNLQEGKGDLRGEVSHICVV